MKKLFFFLMLGAMTIGMVSCSDSNAPVNPVSNQGILPGIFSVSDEVKVQFSQGNLQYQASADKWRFAEHQWDYVGDGANGTVFINEKKCNNAMLSSSYDGWIDLFGWSTSGFGDKNPWMDSGDPTRYLGNGKNDITGSKYDWGLNNPISNGGGRAGMWSTLSNKQWTYLLFNRNNAANLVGFATVHGIGGLILLPDDFVMPTDLPFKPYKSGNNFYDVEYTDDEWERLEKSGAVFLPAAGERTQKIISSVGKKGYYWSTTYYTAQPNFSKALVTAFENQGELRSPFADANIGFSVRLVRTIGQQTTPPGNDILPAPEGAINAIFTLANGQKVYFSQGNLQYQPSANKWRFAPKQWEYTGTYNQNISSSYSDWIDLFGWGTGNNPTFSSTTDGDYSAFTDWGSKIDNSGRWKTMTRDDFNSLASASRYGMGKVNGVNGMIFLPDNWQNPEGLEFEGGLPGAAGLGVVDDGLNNPNGDNYNTANKYTVSQWEKMEANGAVFLPAAGYRDGKTVKEAGEEGRYWTRIGNNGMPYELHFTVHLFGYNSKNNAHCGQSVRLIYVAN